ncbi:MAG: sulfatase-like hydrolase/transferase [Ginsengibacter sp.]
MNLVIDFFSYGILIYSFVLLSCYILIGIYSVKEIRHYRRKNYFADFRILAASDQLPGISILAPAYNEGANIVENVRSMLSIHYNKLELIIINDGSKDDSLQKLITAYDLYRVSTPINEQISTKKVKGIYKSRNVVFHRLVVVDKENGGKSDALNVGVNIASHDYLVCVDVDCVLEQDALLKMIKPFIEETKVRVIASGGVIRIANDCQIENGKLIKINLPKKFLPRVQIIEYIRAFLLGRMAWSRVNGLLLISGAFGAFDKEILIKCGGYDTKTVGEDMELIVRMRRYMEENDLPYKVKFIPDPLCWTEAPANYKILGRQRNRWTRGTIETLRSHKIMFFNPRYGVIGMLSYPYWFFFEFLAPIIEVLGLILFIILAFLGLVNWIPFLVLLGCILLFGFLYSVFAILVEVLTYNQYKNKHDALKLIMTACLEPILFHPFVVWSALRGNIDYLRNKHTWGEMTREGLGAGRIVNIPAEITEENVPVKAESIPVKLKNSIKEYALYSILLTGFMLIIKLYEILRDLIQFGQPENFFKVFAIGIANDISFALNIGLLPVVLFIPLFLLQPKVARATFIFFSVIIITVHVALSEYFLHTLVPLGADLLTYSLADISQTLSAAGVSLNFLITGIAMLSAVIALFIILPKRIRLNDNISYAILCVLVLAFAGSSAALTNKWKPGQEFSNNIALNKSYFFYNSCFRALHQHNEKFIPSIESNNEFDYVDAAQYSFLHTVDSTDVLSPFFKKENTVPNLVFIAVEGLGRAFSNEDAYLGSFTPFLDSLSEKSLYWSNFLSTGGRTFAMLPSVFGSLPFGNNGFLELGDQMPQHASMLSILQKNGYSSNFFYGGKASFDNMNKFLKMNNTKIFDEKTYEAAYSKMPSISGGFTWGYGDEEVFTKYLTSNKNAVSPVCNIVLTLSTHNPFLLRDEDVYRKIFEQRMNKLGFNDEQKTQHRRYTDQYASILYADNAIRKFLREYAERPDFKNTIFIITGDHRMPEIPISTKIDRYHVPLIVYSPLLKRHEKFEAISTHLDITPSILALMKNKYDLTVPSVANWLGHGLDTAHTFRNIHSYPFMQTKSSIDDFVMDEYLLHDDELFKISNNMGLNPVENNEKKNKLRSAFATFKQKNNSIMKIKSMLPDSLLAR